MAIVSKATQEFLPIREIREGVVTLKDGSLRVILMASSLNFALKSEDEQNAIIAQYQNFLNSIDFPLQFFIESRRLDIEPYLLTLDDALRKQINELLKIQIREYIEFIKNFVKSTDIVSKTFYVVVSYTPTVVIPVKQTGLKKFMGFGGGAGKQTEKEEKDTEFEEAKIQLQQRASVIESGLARVEIKAVILNSEELIELFYKLFNPGESEKYFKGNKAMLEGAI
ncbi:MAG: TraC family protein [Patescibacteria group bacterium]